MFSMYDLTCVKNDDITTMPQQGIKKPIKGMFRNTYITK